jgi:hypothetical protein
LNVTITSTTYHAGHSGIADKIVTCARFIVIRCMFYPIPESGDEKRMKEQINPSSTPADDTINLLTLPGTDNRSGSDGRVGGLLPLSGASGRSVLLRKHPLISDFDQSAHEFGKR